MTNFVLVPPHDYVEELLRLVPRFAESVEYKSLDHEDRATAGLVFSAFARFMEASAADLCVTDECRNAIERFASTNDSAIHNLLVTEVFESFNRPETSANLRLPNSRLLYERWMG
jgi:hypothetical protein